MPPTTWPRRAVAEAYALAADSYSIKIGDDLTANSPDIADVSNVLKALDRGSVVLDGGCGPGQVAALAQQQGHLPVALDVTAAMLAHASKRLVHPCLVCADLCQLPLREASCDAAICWFAIHNLPRSLFPHLIKEVRRALRPGGRLVIGTHAGSGEERFRSPSGEEFDFTYYEPASLKDELAAAGYLDVTVRSRPALAHELQVEKLIIFATAPRRS